VLAATATEYEDPAPADPAALLRLSQ
jgi:hypothetical protein